MSESEDAGPMTDEKPEPHVVDGEAIEPHIAQFMRLYDHRVDVSIEPPREAAKYVVTALVEELFRQAQAECERTATLRAERDRLREAAEMADEALKAAMIEVPRPPVCRKITDAREKLRAAFSSTEGDDDA